MGLFLSKAPVIWCDNTSALALASNPVFHGRTKHIEVDYHFVRERVVRGDIRLQFISTDDQVADVFTKAFPLPRFHKLRSKLLFDKNDRKTCIKKRRERQKYKRGPHIQQPRLDL
jgi:hypothetical protein